MAIEHNEHQELSQSFLLDALYCEEQEERWGDLLDDDDEEGGVIVNPKSDSLLPLLLLEQDLFWEDEELLSLFTKEMGTQCCFESFENDPLLCSARVDVVGWIMKVNAHYGFSALTAVLAVTYLDRFLSSLQYQNDKPWMIQLAAVTCLSLAAKVEETHVPLLLDFQVEDAKYVFEAKTIQRMELLVLSSLKWRMNPVTPLSFLDHIIRRLGLKNNVHWEFLRRCESLLLSVMADCRFVRYMPSVLATAIMLHVIHQVEPCNAIEYQNQLLEVLKISKEKVNNCFELISEVSSKPVMSHKRKYDENPSSPSDVIDPICSSESSNDSWDLDSSSYLPMFKKSRVQEEQMKLASSSMSRVFVEAIGSPH
ncbi:Cyclin-D3-1 [Capsicum baccatum]|uniref:Cyclin-D3-1 n=1 Tax=Capsicum baccatum TaxID=33114 RepID=A0A2G2W958_CAPBA|nr:Cyclin-D3-1 [Capsicum baccatum]